MHSTSNGDSNGEEARFIHGDLPSSDSHSPSILFPEVSDILVKVMPDYLVPAIMFLPGNSGSALSKTKAWKIHCYSKE